jgi:hypothetical protein
VVSVRALSRPAFLLLSRLSSLNSDENISRFAIKHLANPIQDINFKPLGFVFGHCRERWPSHAGLYAQPVKAPTPAIKKFLEFDLDHAEHYIRL